MALVSRMLQPSLVQPQLRYSAALPRTTRSATVTSLLHPFADPMDSIAETTTLLLADEDGYWLNGAFDAAAAAAIPFVLLFLLFVLFRLAKLFASAF